MKKLSLFVAAALFAPAMASAQEAASDASYPRCSATVTDHCTEGGGMGGMHHGMHRMTTKHHMMMKHHMKHTHHRHAHHRHAAAKAK